MNIDKQTLNKKTKQNKKTAPKTAYTSRLRNEQAKLTQFKIQNALFELFQEGGSPEGITYKAVAVRAGLTEMTVYRHFPERSLLLKSLWVKINEVLGKNIGMPESADALIEQNASLYAGFDANPSIAVASITSLQGREMRASINDIRRKSFLKIVHELNPQLSRQNSIRIAAVLQLLHSAYAWDSLKLQWDLSGEEISQSTLDAIQVLMNHTKKVRKS